MIQLTDRVDFQEKPDWLEGQRTLNGWGRPSALHDGIKTHFLSLRRNVHLYL